MNTTAYGECDVSYHIECLRRDGEALADLAARAGLAAPVPACPGWQVRDLLRHIGYVHRWAAGYVGEGLEHWRDRMTEAEILAGGSEDDELPGAYRAGHAALVSTLAAADPSLTCWTFLAAPSPLAFWARRQAHETAIHRIDAAQAVTGRLADPGAAFAPEFAADGIDEVIMGFLGREAKRGTWQGRVGTLGIHAAEGDGRSASWRVVSETGRLAVSREPGPADCDVTGAATPLYLLLWNRIPADGLEASGLKVSGDRAVLTRFLHELRITWT